MANITREQFDGLVSSYNEADKFASEKKNELDDAMKKRSDVVKEISKTIAPKKKFMLNGREMTIVVRGETYFLRGPKGDDVFSFDENKT